MKKYNFNAGPSILPREVIENTAKQCVSTQLLFKHSNK